MPHLVPDRASLHKPRMSVDKPFDRVLRRKRRDRAALLFSDADYLHRLAADELLERLDYVKRDFSVALDLGTGTGHVMEQLRRRGLQVASADAGHIFAARANGVQCDEDRLPFADEAFDLIVSVGTLDSVNDLPGALSLIRRALRPDGLFLGALVGAGSLSRLRSAMMAADAAQSGTAAARVHPQIDVRAAGDLLSRAGFALPVVDSDRVTVRYSGLPSLVSDLRAMGATNILASRANPLGRVGMAAAIASFAADAGPDGKTEESFEIVYMIGWAPSPDQPQPARRGSAGRSLAAALRPRNPL